MLRRSIVWRIVTILFVLANVGGAIYAAMMGEMRHAGLHVVLALIGASVGWQFATSRRDAHPALAGAAAGARESAQLANRLTNLERSLDVIAEEVERVGEGQRYMTQLFSERGERKPDQK
jgi:hypothetical protein